MNTISGRILKCTSSVVRSMAILAISALAFSAPTHAKADEITIPNNYYIGNFAPFGALGNGYYQQVFSSSFFNEPISISRLSFFIPGYTADSGNTGFASGSYHISLSTTTIAVGALDPTNFQNNLGFNDAVFFEGNLNGGSSIIGTPFTYVPGDGNLLFSVKVSGRALDSALLSKQVGAFYRGDNDLGTSRGYYFPDFVDSYISDTSGLDIAFTFSKVQQANVPEPSTLLLLTLGLCALGLRGIKKDTAQRLL